MQTSGQGFAPPPRHLHYWTARQKLLLILSALILIGGVTGAAYWFINQQPASAPKRTDFHNTRGRDWVPPAEKEVPAAARPAATVTPRTAVASAVNPRLAQGGGSSEDKILKSNINIPNQGASITGFLHERKAAPAAKNDDPEAQAEGEDNALSKDLARSNLGPKSKARVDEHYLYTISAGRLIPCNHLRARNTQLPGFVSCNTEQAVWNDDNSAILLPAGTHFFGEIKSNVLVGNDRVPILWREIRTPDHPPIKVAINSPGADALGRPGDPLVVNNHVWERLLATLTYTLIEAVPNAAIAAIQNHGNSRNEIQYNQFATPTQNLGGSVLQRYMNRPPIGEGNPGETVMISIGTDIDLYPALGFRIARGSTR